jgi:competence ComEA-like helix-hairpin-helix protein
VALLLTLALGLLTWHVVAAQPWMARPTSLEPADFRVDLNQADQAQLRQLPGVGEALAERILERRHQLGGFRKLEDLRQVKGIGPAILERLRPNVRIGPYQEVEEPPDEDDPPPPRVVRAARPDEPTAPTPSPRSTRKVTPQQPIDINRAGPEELKTLPGIGPTLAARILEARQQKPFASVEELRRIRGIGPKTFEGLRPFVRTGSTPVDTSPSR